jgi:hypothetical protein
MAHITRNSDKCRIGRDNQVHIQKARGQNSAESLVVQSQYTTVSQSVSQSVTRTFTLDTKTWLFHPHHLPACFSPQRASLELLPCFFACLGNQKRDVSAADLPEEHASCLQPKCCVL